MNNKDFIAELSARMGYSAGDTQRLVTNIVNAMSDGFLEENAVMVPNFGTFEVKKKMERISVNPVSGKRYLIPPKLMLAYRQSALLKEKFNESGDFAEIPDDNEDETVNE